MTGRASVFHQADGHYLSPEWLAFGGMVSDACMPALDIFTGIENAVGREVERAERNIKVIVAKELHHSGSGMQLDFESRPA